MTPEQIAALWSPVHSAFTLVGGDIKALNVLIASLQSNSLTEAQVNAIVEQVVGNAPEALNTLAEIAAAMAEDDTAAGALVAAVASKASQADVTALTLTVANKASQESLFDLVGQVSGKASQESLSYVVGVVAGKASNDSVVDLVAQVASKASNDSVVDLVAQVASKASLQSVETLSATTQDLLAAFNSLPNFSATYLAAKA